MLCRVRMALASGCVGTAAKAKDEIPMWSRRRINTPTKLRTPHEPMILVWARGTKTKTYIELPVD